MKMLPMPIKATPYEHQRNAYEFACKKFGLLPTENTSNGLALLMEMGTGKPLTSTAISTILFKLRKVRRVLVVAPISILPVWKEEFKKFTDTPHTVTILKGSSREKAAMLKYISNTGRLSSGKYVNLACSYIEDHMTYDISIQDVADYVKIDRSHLYRLFVKHLGISPSKYLSEVRMKRAIDLMEYVLMAISILFSVVNAGLLRSFANKTKENKYSSFIFNAGVSVVWMAILTAWLLISGDKKISTTAVIYGIVYGVILGLFLLFKMRATAEGPVSLTTLIGSCAFIIATGFSVFYAGESVSFIQLVGMGLLLVSLVLCINPKKSGEKLTGKWFFNCFVFFLVGGLVEILYKLFGKSAASDQVNTMILVASVVSGIFFISGGFVEAKKNHRKIEKPTRLVLLYMLLCGIAGCIYIRLNVSLSKVIPGAIFFPVSNGGMVILSTIMGKILFGEKLKPIQITGILIGLIAIIINGCGDVLFELIK